MRYINKRIVTLFCTLIVLISLTVVNCANEEEVACGNSSLSESEPNETFSNADSIGDLNATCTSKVTGYIGILAVDIFSFNTGDASTITFTVTWSSGDDALDLVVQDSTGTAYDFGLSAASNSETLTWTVDSKNVTRYIVVTSEIAWGDTNYTMNIEAK
ncbi:MAG: hypothetical protein ABUK01_13765 [Leptospirales bacterium]